MNYQNPIDRCKCVAELGGGDMNQCDQVNNGNRLMVLVDQSFLIWIQSNISISNKLL